MAPTTLLYNLLAGAGTLAALVLGPRLPPPLRFARWPALVLWHLALSAALGEGMFGILRLLTWGLFCQWPLALLATAWRERRGRGRRAVALGSAAAAAGLLAVAIHAFLIEPRWLQVDRFHHRVPGLSRPLRVVVVSDLQAEALGSYEREVLARALALAPDLILMAGDAIQISDPRARRRVLAEFNEHLRGMRFGAPLGVFVVRGNTDAGDWPAMWSGTGAELFTETRSLALPELTITGLSLEDSFAPDLQLPASDRPHLVFGHAPDFALGRIAAEVLVAGHTHGGQVRVPWFGPPLLPPLILSKVPRSWGAGLTPLPGGRALLVTRGAGLERGHAPRLRFLCRPEIAVLELEPAR